MVRCEKYAHLGNEGNPDFNWSLYENGWNGSGLQKNNTVKSKDNDSVFCHEKYAQDLYNRYRKIQVDQTKDIRKGDLVSVTDINVIDNDTLAAVICNGANNIMIDLNKETKFYQQFNINNVSLTKKRFVDELKSNPEFKQQILSQNLLVKVTTDTEKGSLWDGYTDKVNKDLMEQITAKNNAYWATITGINNGGFVVELCGAVKAFMPGSMAAVNRILDYDSFVGKSLEVMVVSWSPKYGFVVSRKEYLQRMRPYKIQPIRETLKKEPNKIYTGTVTGATQFGVFVELDEFITGMLHKTLVSDELREAMRQGTIETGTEMQVYVHRIDKLPNGDERVILSDVPVPEREAVIERRTAEDNAEKSEHVAQKAAMAATATEQNTQTEQNG